MLSCVQTVRPRKSLNKHQLTVGQPLDKIKIDFHIPFTRSSRGKVYIIVAIDYATKWVA